LGVGLLVVMLHVTLTYKNQLQVSFSWDTGVRGLTRGVATHSQSIQEPLKIKTKLEDPHMSSWWANPWNVIFSLQCF